MNLSNASTAQASFIVPPVDAVHSVRLRLEVTDDGGARSSTEISVTVRPADVELIAGVASGSAFKVDDETVELVVNGISFSGTEVQPVRLSWHSSVQGELVARASIGRTMDVALQAATHTLTLVADCGALGTVRRTFELPVLPRMLPPTAVQQTPAAGHTALMPVVAVSFVPTLDGNTLDLDEANYTYRPPEWSGNRVAEVLRYTELLTTRSKWFLEERSRFRGYKDAAAQPWLGYQVVAHYVFYEPVPLSSRLNPYNNSQRMADMVDIMDRIDGQSLVEQQNVREIWLWTYFNEKIGLWESNMSSPTTGDISNSDQFAGDLPVFNKTYYVYGYNYHRTQAEAMHEHAHQLERMLSYVDWRESGNTDLFWGRYVGMPDGRFPAGQTMNLGRCGWTHSPPNTAGNYDYLNQTLVESDCEDWRPEGNGTRKSVNSAYFGALPYNWPGGASVPQKAETQFYLWWMQNMPGDGNAIPYGASTMENWWRFIADWDGAINEGLRLYR